ncbi:hypothetical protein [Nitrosococcus oceani]|uniref:hypothetical protein n=1 Tax=Nitrosococcus oceani TaxID=1229 RepID=UPI0012E0080E|nr:hypothetical protein [Nitrosococcus oceani]
MTSRKSTPNNAMNPDSQKHHSFSSRHFWLPVVVNDRSALRADEPLSKVTAWTVAASPPWLEKMSASDL